MNEKLFSILIPCYNTSQFLRECIDSVISQNASHYEIICVDDGSTDNTAEVLKEIECKYPNIVKVHLNSHKGVSATRNYLLELATGRYIIFLDSDDIMEEGYLEKLSQACIDISPDCIIGNYKCISGTGNEISSSILQSDKINGRSHEEVLEYLYQDRCVYALCRFIVKRDIIESAGITFNEKILHEDEDWVSRILLECQTFYNIPHIQFKYRRRDGSITMNPTTHNYWSKLEVAQGLLLESEKYSDYKKKHLLRKVYRLCKEMYYTIMENVGDERRD